MLAAPGQAFPSGSHHWIRADFRPADLAEGEGWIGIWEVFRGDPDTFGVLVASGLTDAESTSDSALAMAKALAQLEVERRGGAEPGVLFRTMTWQRPIAVPSKSRLQSNSRAGDTQMSTKSEQEIQEKIAAIRRDALEECWAYCASQDVLAVDEGKVRWIKHVTAKGQVWQGVAPRSFLSTLLGVKCD